MKKILVPTDFSKCAGNALQYAFEVARRVPTGGASVHLLHVVFPAESVENNVYHAMWIDKYLDERRRSLMRLAKRYQKTPELKALKVEVEVQIGFPATMSNEIADKIDADLIVMGTTGATGLRGAILGSTASTLAAKTRRPLLVVPPRSTFSEGGSWAFATDFRADLDKKSLSVLKNLIQMHKTRLRAVHILEKTDAPPDKGREILFREKLHDLPLDFHYLHNPDVVEAISDFIDSTDATGMVAVAHEHGLFHRIFYPSITQKLTESVRLPMLVLHD